MVFEQVNQPRSIFLPTFAGDFNKYSSELTLSLTTHVRELWARAETLDANSNIADKVIKTAYIDDLAVGTAQIAALSVTAAQIADATITTAKIGLLQVTDALIGSCAVGKLLAGSITSKIITLVITPTAGDVCIKCGKTDFGDNTAGFILGIDDSVAGDPAKFEIGDATNYMKWDGSALTIRGALNADDIDAGTLTSRTVQTAADGMRFVVSADDNEAHFFGDRGDTTIAELISLGRSASGDDFIIADIGSNDLSGSVFPMYVRGGASTLPTIAASAGGVGARAIYAYSTYDGATWTAAIYGAGFSTGVQGVASAVSGTRRGYGVYCAMADEDHAMAPICLQPSAGAGVPDWTAAKGCLWVTSAGVLYINTDGAATWAKVGAQ